MLIFSGTGGTKMDFAAKAKADKRTRKNNVSHRFFINKLRSTGIFKFFAREKFY